MTTVIPAAFETIPDGTQWPDPHTPALLNRDLRPGTDPAGLSRFCDDRWHLNQAVFEDHTKAICLNFATISRALRQEVKFYVWQLLNHRGPMPMPWATSVRPAVSTVVVAFAQLKSFLTWLDSREVASLGEITLPLLDDYLRDVADEEISLELKYRKLAEVRRLWAYRTVLPSSMRLPAAPPWDGEDSRELFGRIRGTMDNRTRRIAERTMQLLLLWSIRFVDDFADDILAAHAEHLDLHTQTPDTRRRYGITRDTQHWPGELEAKVGAYLQTLRERGEALPGKRDKDGVPVVDWRHLGRVLDSASFSQTRTGHLVRESGLPVGDYSPLDAPVTARLDGGPWLPGRIGFHQAPNMARLLTTACFVIISYLSGARSGEVLNLRRGCIEHDRDNDLWLMSGLFFKNARNKDGSKAPAGETRRDPWVVVKVVARAVGVLERLHPHQLLFPTRIELYHRLEARTAEQRKGKARTDEMITTDLADFTGWVNDLCDRTGRTDHIPADAYARLHPSRFRRTLAWFIRRRPRGLVAASIQYGHVHTRLLQGYAGSYASGFPDDYAFEDWLYRIERIAEDEQALRDGEHVSGPPPTPTAGG
ncbi:hypothetical protein [Embleya sp. NPDC059237]|uniref:hypothetical protein n=1 Tax=Embleya sp. NPDC059237 TaxID=3346784 RepID=UPI0036755842